MSYTLYSITGCTRCKILKAAMADKELAYEEKNMLAEGKEDFQKFYSQNRKFIVRGAEGIEFPLLHCPVGILQGLPATLAQVLFDVKLNGFVSVGSLHKEWVDGLHVSGGNPYYADDFLQLLRTIKSNNMKLQLETDGRNPALLERILAENLASVVIMNVLGPARIYPSLLGQDVNPAEIQQSIELVAKSPEYKFLARVTPQLTPADVGETAQRISEATGSMKTPYYLKPVDPNEPGSLLPHRSAARRFLVLTDIETACQ